MLARALIVCLALGLAAADPLPQPDVILCSKFTPLADLHVSQLVGDWLAIAQSLHHKNGAPKTLPSLLSGPAHPSICGHMRFHRNSSESDVSATLSMHGGGRNLRDEDLHYRVAESGRFIDKANETVELLVTEIVPDKYFLSAECHEYLAEGSSTIQRVPRTVGLWSRYRKDTGETLLSQQEASDIVQKVTELLGVSEFKPLLLDTTCFDQYLDSENTV